MRGVEHLTAVLRGGTERMMKLQDVLWKAMAKKIRGRCRFYEKVVKVKADVAAILICSSVAVLTPHRQAHQRCHIGGMRKGGFSGAF